MKTPVGKRHALCVEFSSTAVPSRIREAIRKLVRDAREAEEYPVLSSRFLSERVRAICREEGAGYLDLAGNCFLHLEDLYVEKVVEHNPFPSRGRPSSLFASVSSRLIRALLEEPSRSWQVIELAGEASVSLGHTSNICRRLLDEEYLIREGRRLRLAQPGRLLDAWRDEYALAKHMQLLYYSFERDPEAMMSRLAEQAKAHRLRYAVTMFAAASVVAPFVRGVGMVQWYVEDEAAAKRWTQALDLRPVESGPNVGLLVPSDPGVFYRTQTIQGVDLVSNTQLYVDLFSAPARGREQAEFLRQQALRF